MIRYCNGCHSNQEFKVTPQGKFLKCVECGELV